MVLPYSGIKLRSIFAGFKKPGTWKTTKLSGGTFTRSRSLDTSLPAFSEERVVYAGPVKNEIKSDPGMSLKNGILCLDLQR